MQLLKRIIFSGGILLGVQFIIACGSTDSLAARRLPDLQIDSVRLEAGRVAAENFPYNEYIATVVIKNTGGYLKTKDLYLSAGEDQVNLKVKTDEEYFQLSYGESAVVSYQVLKPADLIEESITFKIDTGDNEYEALNGGNVEESNEENNGYSVNFLK